MAFRNRSAILRALYEVKDFKSSREYIYGMEANIRRLERINNMLEKTGVDLLKIKRIVVMHFGIDEAPRQGI